MSLTYWIPFFIVVLGNIGYHVVAKATSVSAPPFLALSVTYLVSFLLCAAAYVVTGTSLRQDLPALNWASAAWGLTLVAVEFGYILYTGLAGKSAWPPSWLMSAWRSFWQASASCCIKTS